MYYKSKITGKIISEKFARALNYVYGRDTIDNLLDEGTLVEERDPSLEDCIRHGGGNVATVRYMEMNPDLSWSDASEEVRRLRKEFRDHDRPKVIWTSPRFEASEDPE